MYSKYKNKSGHFYMLEFENALKFGITTRLKVRMDEYRKRYPNRPFRIIDTRYFEVFSQARLIEKLLVKILKPNRINGSHEWLNEKFTIRDMLQCYDLAYKIVMSSYVTCNEAEWDSLIHYPISELKLNKMIERVV